MRYLLDTHAFIWAIIDQKKLSATVKNILENPDNEILVSAVTYWEIAVKSSLGKLNLSGVFPQDLPTVASATGFESIEMNPIECATFHFLEAQFHKDPFDRMLIWQAIYQNLILVTKDSDIIKYRSAGLKTIW